MEEFSRSLIYTARVPNHDNGIECGINFRACVLALSVPHRVGSEVSVDGSGIGGGRSEQDAVNAFTHIAAKLSQRSALRR